MAISRLVMMRRTSAQHTCKLALLKFELLQGWCRACIAKGRQGADQPCIVAEIQQLQPCERFSG